MWDNKKIGELVSVRRGSSPRPIKDYIVDEGIPWVKIADATSDSSRYISSTKEFIKKEGIKNSVLVKPGTLIVSNSATPGLPKIMKIEACVHDGWLIIDDYKGILKEFLYYQFIVIRNKLVNQANGSVFKNLKTDIVRDFNVNLPSIDTQKKIVEILNNINEKIETNYKINKNLETIGNELFKKWFVHFEFLDENGQPYKSSGGEMVDSELGEIPIGWQLKPLDEIANYLNGLALQKYPPENDNYLPVIKIRELKQGITQQTDKASIDIPKEYIICDGDVIFSWSGSLKIVIWGEGKGALNQHLFKVTSEEYPKWFYYYQTLKFLPNFRQIAADKATTMGHIKRIHLTESIVAVPPDNILKQANIILNPILEQIINNKVNSRYLSSIRDSLLPKLMSGEIDVSKIEI